jgi:hypothetical protein
MAGRLQTALLQCARERNLLRAPSGSQLSLFSMGRSRASPRGNRLYRIRGHAQPASANRCAKLRANGIGLPIPEPQIRDAPMPLRSTTCLSFLILYSAKYSGRSRSQPRSHGAGRGIHRRSDRIRPGPCCYRGFPFHALKWGKLSQQRFGDSRRVFAGALHGHHLHFAKAGLFAARMARMRAGIACRSIHPPQDV